MRAVLFAGALYLGCAVAAALPESIAEKPVRLLGSNPIPMDCKCVGSSSSTSDFHDRELLKFDAALECQGIPIPGAPNGETWITPPGLKKAETATLDEAANRDCEALWFTNSPTYKYGTGSSENPVDGTVNEVLPAQTTNFGTPGQPISMIYVLSQGWNCVKETPEKTRGLGVGLCDLFLPAEANAVREWSQFDGNS
ncbi:MAG: hypothetical protein M1833_005781 [Piccolia ochrophora]|nr:MAG: hypothetical protein M1833_005781 [Piccolia ochrophora]